MSAATSSHLRLLLVGLALAVASLAVVLLRSGGPAALPLHDFVEYWSAGKLLLNGQNPYDPDLVHELERQAGHTGEGFLMWNPPWVLPLVLPLGLLPVRTAHLLWLLFHFGAVVFSADVLWRLYGGSPARRSVPLLAACTFAPVIIALIAGQISPLLLLGVVGFLALVRDKRDLAAGAAAALLGIKPHLVYLFWPAVLLWAIHQRRWRVLAGGVLAGVGLTGVAMLFDPHILGHYWHTLTTQPPAQYRSPTLGFLIRLALGGGSFRWQFLALVPGLVWFAITYWRHRASWDWAERMPLLLLVSMLTAAYGAWPFDLVILLVPVTHVAALVSNGRGTPAAVIAHGLINGLAVMQVLRGVEYLGFIWMTPALLLAYVVLRHAAVQEPAPSPRPA